jgi:hypothetical protein
MNYFDLYSSYPDHTIAAAWDSQVTEADTTPWLTECGGELFTRFAACYAELRALPRSARRALQRRLARSTELAAILPEYLQRGGRRLQHRMAWSLAGAALLLALGQGVGSAATITVTTNNPNIIADGQCSLIEAIVNANNDAATYPDCVAGSGADTIVLPANANISILDANGTNQYNGPVGLPQITTQITIQGNGATISRPGSAPAFGLMAVTGGDLTLQSITLTGGSGNCGGAVCNSGTLTIKNSTISGNTAGSGSGGAVNNSGTLTIKDSAISGNTAHYGGGVYSYFFSDNTIENSTISGNTADAGGGVLSHWGFLTITNSTISDNAANHGGGVHNAGGGGVTLTNSTITGNRADGGGGVYNDGGCIRNEIGQPFCFSATLTLNNSLITGNQATVGPEIENYTGSIVNANNFNLFGANGNAGVSGFTPGPTDIVPSVALSQILGPLKNNGGPTQTHALVAGSPAIDAGDPNGCRDSSGAPLQTDQRGFARNVDGNHDGIARCDIGAVEFGAGAATTLDFDGDGKSDIGIYRDGTWSIVQSSDGSVVQAGWGDAGWISVPGDYDGDGKTDLAVYFPTEGVWSIVRSSDGGNTVVIWGAAGWQPVPGDYDGDGKTDIAVYNPTNAAWAILRSSDGSNTGIIWGAPGWQPIPADYDGDGKTDIAVYNPTNAAWAILRSSDGGNTGIIWGAPGWQPVPADYDGDGKTDIAVYNPTNAVWAILRSSDAGNTGIIWGAPGWQPVPADYDGDGKTDIAVYNSTGIWSIIRSSDGGNSVVDLGGAPNDVPIK